MDNDLDDDDLLESLGVRLPEPKQAKAVVLGHKPPKLKPERHTNWSNAATFTFGGYLARIKWLECQCCGEGTKICEGIFIEEIHLPSGTRRLQQMAKGSQWPQGGGHRQEVWTEKVEVCGKCVADLGFDRIVDGRGMAMALVKREESES